MSNRRSNSAFLTLLFIFQSAVSFGSLANFHSDSSRFEILQKASSEELSYNYPAALKKGLKVLKDANNSGNQEAIAAAQNELGLLYWVDGYYYTAIVHLDTAYNLYLSQENIGAAASTQHTIALNYYYMARNDSAIFYHQKALEMYMSVKDHRMAAKVLSHIALVYHKMGNYQKTISFILESSKLRDEHSESLSAYDFKSSNPAFRDSSYYLSELEINKSDLAEAEQNQDTLQIAEFMHNIGVIYYALEDFNRALWYFDEANLKYASLSMLPYWNESVRALLKLARFDEALEVIDFYKGVIESRGTRITLSEVYGLEGDIYYEGRDYKHALESYLKFRELSAAMNNRLSLASCYRKLAKTYLAQNNFKESERYGLMSLALTKEISAIEGEKATYSLLSEISLKRGNYIKALEYEQSHLALVNQINEGEASVNMVKAQAAYELFKNNKEINMLHLEGLVKETQVKNMRMTIISVLLFSIAFLALTVILYHQNHLKAQSNKLLEAKTVEIAEQAKQLAHQNRKNELLLSEIHHRVKNNLQLVNSMLSVHALQLKDPKAKMAVVEGQNRVEVMGLIHQNLYQKHNFGAIDMQEYLVQLAHNLAISHGFSSNVSFAINTNELTLVEETAIYIGLITNELLTNSFKYAFRDVSNPSISIILTNKNNELRLDISDNGNGVEDFDETESYGLTLVKELVARLRGDIEYNCDDGTKVCLRIREYKLAV